jgi:hypothetical protein
MDAKKFLQQKGIVLDDEIKENHKVFLGGKGGSHNVVDLLEEYALIKAHEIMLMKNK